MTTPLGFFATWKMASFRPAEFYALPQAHRSAWSSQKFALVISAVMLAALSFWTVLLRSKGLELRSAALVATILFFIGPIVTLPGIYCVAGIAHGLLFAVRRPRPPLRETVDVVSYSLAPYALVIIPLAGVLLGVWLAWRSLITGIAAIYGLSRARAFGLMLLASVICFIAARGLSVVAVRASLPLFIKDSSKREFVDQHLARCSWPWSCAAHAEWNNLCAGASETATRLGDRDLTALTDSELSSVFEPLKMAGDNLCCPKVIDTWRAMPLAAPAKKYELLRNEAARQGFSDWSCPAMQRLWPPSAH